MNRFTATCLTGILLVSGDRFSDRLVKNQQLHANPTLREANTRVPLPGLKFMRTLFLCEATGGPCQYTGKELHEAHAHLHISSEEFDEVAAELDRTMDELNVPEPEQQEVLAFMASKKSEVVTKTP
jgi:hemoglobin